MATYIIVNDKGEYFTGFFKATSTGFSKSARLGGHEPKFVPFTNHSISVLLIDEAGIEETETDLKLFNINYQLIEVNS